MLACSRYFLSHLHIGLIGARKVEIVGVNFIASSIIVICARDISLWVDFGKSISARDVFAWGICIDPELSGIGSSLSIK